MKWTLHLFSWKALWMNGWHDSINWSYTSWWGCFCLEIMHMIMMHIKSQIHSKKIPMLQYLPVTMPVIWRVTDIWRIGDHIWAVNVIDGFIFRKSSQIPVVKNFISKLCLRKGGKKAVRIRKNMIRIQWEKTR